MKIKLTTIYVTDQDKALRFYTEALGFLKKADITNGPYRWLTVTSPAEPDGTELQIAAADPVAKAFIDARLAAKQPAIMFDSDDVKADCERIAKKAELAMPATDVGYAWIAQINDTCGNLIQLVQRKH